MTNRRDRAGEEVLSPTPRGPLEAVERLFALRAEDLDGWEQESSRQLDEGERAELEQQDRLFGELLGKWVEEEESRIDSLELGDFSLPSEPRLGGGRLRRVSGRPWAAALLAASLAVASFAFWDVQAPMEIGESPAGLKAVSGQQAAQLDLQFSVERQVGGAVLVEAGRTGASYGSADRLAMRLALHGRGGWAYLLEVEPGAEPRLLHPQSEEGWPVEPGVHDLLDASGTVTVYQPEEFGSRVRYLALVTSEPVPAVQLAAGLLSVGLDRPSDWPRPVLAADSFVVEWTTDP